MDFDQRQFTIRRKVLKIFGASFHILSPEERGQGGDVTEIALFSLRGQHSTISLTCPSPPLRMAEIPLIEAVTSRPVVTEAQ